MFGLVFRVKGLGGLIFGSADDPKCNMDTSKNIFKTVEKSKFGQKKRRKVRKQTELIRLSRGRRRGVETLLAELEHPQSPVIAVDMSAEVQRLACSGGVHTDPNPKRVCRREDSFHNPTRSGAAIVHRSGEDIPTLVHSSVGVATDHPRTVFSDAFCSGEQGEVIRVRCRDGRCSGGRGRQPGAKTGESSPSTGPFF